MSLLNRPSEYDYLYDSEGRLQGGLSALEELAQVISMGSGDEEKRDPMDEESDEIEPALEFPIHGAPQDSSSLLDSDEDMSDDEGPGSFEDDPMEDVSASGELKSSDGNSKSRSGFSPLHTRSPADTLPLSTSPVAATPPSDVVSPGGDDVSPRRKGSDQSLGSEGSTIGRRSAGSRRSSKRLTLTDVSQSGVSVPLGERLKHKILEDNVLTTILVSKLPVERA
jgi:serine/threonine-protein phosphatase 6 regulatory subunit 3